MAQWRKTEASCECDLGAAGPRQELAVALCEAMTGKIRSSMEKSWKCVRFSGESGSDVLWPLNSRVNMRLGEHTVI